MEATKTSSNTSYKKSSFGPAFFFVSPRRRAALAAYYEFCRLMDDIVDEPRNTDPGKELDFWQAEIERVFNGSAQTDLGKRLSEVIKEFDLSSGRFLLLIEGMRADLQGKTYATLEALDWYLYRVAVVVGLATLDILDVKGPQANALALSLGSAVQLTNIIRDVSQDAKLQRVYLPDKVLAQFGLTRKDILTGQKPEETARALSFLDEKAQQLYEQSFMLMRQWPRLKMLPCRMMACVYAKNLAKIRKGGFLSGSPLKLTEAEKLMGVLYAGFQTFFA
ncbi:MAG: squalene/phytoene synthase family protein [Elusimicrobiaceae bacterium]|nr:squalene/phytoene synthase family protein [Elusimicrobiaceae bacterium]